MFSCWAALSPPYSTDVPFLHPAELVFHHIPDMSTPQPSRHYLLQKADSQMYTDIGLISCSVLRPPTATLQAGSTPQEPMPSELHNRMRHCQHPRFCRENRSHLLPKVSRLYALSSSYRRIANHPLNTLGASRARPPAVIWAAFLPSSKRKRNSLQSWMPPSSRLQPPQYRQLGVPECECIRCTGALSSH